MDKPPLRLRNGSRRINPNFERRRQNKEGDKMNCYDHFLEQIESGQITGRYAMEAFAERLKGDGNLDKPVLANATALGWACGRRNLELVAALLEAGALPDGLSEGSANDRISPMASAMNTMQSSEGRACAELLYRAGASVDKIDPAGLAPLHYAAMFKRGIEGINWLLSKGANPNAIGARGLAPIHVAAGLENIEAAKALVGAGADPRALADCEVLGIQLADGQKLMSALDLANSLTAEGRTMAALLLQAAQARTDREDLDISIDIPPERRLPMKSRI